MYLKSRVKIPDVHGKITRLRRGNVTYIKYEYDRYYDPVVKPIKGGFRIRNVGFHCSGITVS